MFSKINSFSTRGIDGYRITVEVDVSNGLPSFVMVGYLAEEVREAQERVRTALRNAGVCLPPKRITVNLSPAGVRKEGTGCDLAIAAGILRCLWEQGEKAKIRKTDETCPEMDGMEDEENNSAPDWDQWAFIGELGLDGSIKPLTGVLSMVYEARRCGMKRVFLSEENVQEGRAVDGNRDRRSPGCESADGCAQHPEQIHDNGRPHQICFRRQEEFDVDFDEIVGLPLVRQATEAAAAGRHNILLSDRLGTGKTMAARRIPDTCCRLRWRKALKFRRYTASAVLEARHAAGFAASVPQSASQHDRPGDGRRRTNLEAREIPLASYGTLFLDELTEFQPKIWDPRRQPMEEGSITVSRLNQTVVFPAKTMIAAAMNPCKCGFFPDLGKCRCTPTPDPPVSEPRFGDSFFRSDRYWGGSIHAGFGMMAAEKSIDEGSFPQTEQRGIPPLSCAPASWRARSTGKEVWQINPFL